ncbi:MAG: chlorite dismutase family protein [Nitrososphaerales archaeon]
MSNNSKRKFLNFSFFKIDSKWRWMNGQTKQDSAKEFISIINAADTVQCRTYSTLGLREDADFLLWFISDDVDSTQDIISKLYYTVLGKYINSTYNYLSATRPSTYAPSAVPAFMKGEKPLRYLIVYPFIKSRKWYLLPFEERKKMMEEHIVVGRKFPQVKLNTTYSFGLGDQDFMLAFETDDLSAFQDLIMQLREIQVSKYIVKDTPMMVCVRKELEELIRSLG